MAKDRIYVVAAVVVRDGRVLCVQRTTGALAGLWEFPGGKIEPGETPQEALEREITEELRCGVEVGDRVAQTSHRFPFGRITLTAYYCKLISGTPQLTEHAEVRWCTPTEMTELDWAPTDVPVIKRIQDDLRV